MANIYSPEYALEVLETLDCSILNGILREHLDAWVLQGVQILRSPNLYHYQDVNKSVFGNLNDKQSVLPIAEELQPATTVSFTTSTTPNYPDSITFQSEVQHQRTARAWSIIISVCKNVLVKDFSRKIDDQRVTDFFCTLRIQEFPFGRTRSQNYARLGSNTFYLGNNTDDCVFAPHTEFIRFPQHLLNLEEINFVPNLSK